jgi:outer membrane protein
MVAVSASSLVLVASSVRADTNLTGMTELTVRDAVRIALEDNPSLSAAAARAVQAQARLSQARSQYWPAVESSASAAHIDTADAAYRAELGVDNPETYYRAELGASWVLFNGFARRFSVALARCGAEESQAAMLEARRQIALAVTQVYLSAQLARESMAIAEADAAFNARLLEETRATRAAGGGSLSDELNFEIRANAAAGTLIEARRDYALTRIGLAALMGIPAAALPEGLAPAPLFAETPAELVTAEADKALQQAVADRPDLVRARAGVARTEAAVGGARAAYLPSLALSAKLNGERAEDPGFSSDDFGSTAGITLSYSFFDGGKRRAALRESRASEDEAVSQLRETELSVLQETREALAALEAAQAQLRLQRRNTSLVERNRELVEKEYAAGQTSLTRLNEAQRDLVSARVQLARARIALRKAWAELGAATGDVVNTGVGEAPSEEPPGGEDGTE